MDQKYYILKFAATGSTAVIPDANPGDGNVSYDTGYGSDYELDLATQASAKAMERTKQNGLFQDMTENLKQYQEHGTAEFITTTDNGGAPFPYDKGAKCIFTDGLTYISLTAANVTTPPDISWKLDDSLPQNYKTSTGGADTIILDATVGDSNYDLPNYQDSSMIFFQSALDNTGATTLVIGATLTAKPLVINNVALTGGEVSANTPYGAVYNITNDNFELITFNISLGNGQAWVDVSGSRIEGVTYTNTTGKPIQLSITGIGAGVFISIDGVNISRFDGGAYSTHNQIIPDNSTYSVTSSLTTYDSWFELR